MSIFWEFWQNSRIADAEATAERATHKADNTSRHIEDRIAARLDNIVLANTAVWALMREKFGLTDEDLMNKMEEIDLADGKRDGRMGRTMQVCPSCKRRSAEHHGNCLYCGQAFGPRSPFGG